MSKINLSTGMLAFARSLQISEALLWARAPASDGTERRLPIEVQEKGVRSQNASSKTDNPGASSPHTVDQAAIPAGCTGLLITFNGRIMAGSVAPHATNKGEVSRSYGELSKGYAEAGGYHFLAERYIWNILNGRFAWRNRLQSDTASVTVRFDGLELVSDPLEISMDVFPGRAALTASLRKGDADILARLIDSFAIALYNPEKSFDFAVEWSSVLPGGSEVWPSQEYIREARVEKDRSRVYAVIPSFFADRLVKQASIHSQKINAALRHIDEWHGNENYGAVAVNPYAGVQETSDVLRTAKKGQSQSFFSVMSDGDHLMDELTKAPENMDPNTHFFFANLIRGGVYGVSSGEAKPKAEPKSKKKVA